MGKKKETLPLTKELVKKAEEKFRKIRTENSRVLSWEHCIATFADAFKKGKHDNDTVDYLCLHLGFYLASWGMMRKSKLREYDYKIHAPLVKELLNPKLEYSKLAGNELECFCDQNSETFKKLDDLYKEVAKHCEQFSTANASGILVSKIIMGTLGIVPAYDTNLSAAVKKYDISNGTFSLKAFNQLAQYFINNNKGNKDIKDIMVIVDRLRDDMKKDNEKVKGCQYYTRAKIIDALLWEIGYKIPKEKKEKQS